MRVVTSDKQLEKLNRRRVKKACDSCRLKKTKCDGRKPCSKCLMENKVCVFANKLQVKERNHHRGYVELLETKVELLGKSLEKLIVLARNYAPFLNDFVSTDSTVQVNKVIEFLLKNDGLLDSVNGNVRENMVNQGSREITNITARLRKNFDGSSNEEEHIYDGERENEENSQNEEDHEEDVFEGANMDKNESRSNGTIRHSCIPSLRDFSSEHLPYAEGDFLDDMIPDSVTSADFRLKNLEMCTSADYIRNCTGEVTDKEELSPDLLLLSEGSQLLPKTLLPHNRSELPKSLLTNSDYANTPVTESTTDIWGSAKNQVNINEPHNLDYDTLGISNAYDQLLNFSGNFDLNISPSLTNSDKETLDFLDVKTRFFELTP